MQHFFIQHISHRDAAELARQSTFASPLRTRNPASSTPQATPAAISKGALSGLPVSRIGSRRLDRPEPDVARRTARSFAAPGNKAHVPTLRDALVAAVLSRAQMLVLSKGRYEPLVARYMQDTHGISIEPSKAAITGEVVMKRGAKRFKYMRDAEIPNFVTRRELSVGFAGSHQVYGARAAGALPGLRDIPVIAHPTARFVLAAHETNIDMLLKKISTGQTLILATEYVASGRRIAAAKGWPAYLYRSGKGMAEIDAGEFPERFDGVIAIADTGNTLAANDLRIVREFDPLAPLAIHLLWQAKERSGRASSMALLDVPPERPERQARWNPWLDGTHADRIKKMLAAPHRRTGTERNQTRNGWLSAYSEDGR
jgi:ATP phosphoribosyltransferase